MAIKFKGQQKWVRETLIKFGELQKEQPSPFNKDPDWPEWVDNLWMMLMGISYPGSKIANVKNWKAKDLGRFLGRHYAGEHVILGQVPLSSKVIQEGLTSRAWAESRAKQIDPNVDLLKVQKRFDEESKLWFPKFQKFIRETLASVCDRPYHESSAFFEAFGKAIIIRPDDLLTERTMGVGDKICWTMIVMWPEISNLKSVGEVHRLFERALKPKGIVVKYKRIEKLCQRIGLKFKGPGRPLGSKNSDKSPSALG